MGLGHREISARALVLAPVPGAGTDRQAHVTLLIQLYDGTVTVGRPLWRRTPGEGVLRPGVWVPVTLPLGKPDEAKLIEAQIPDARDVGAVIAEALGGPSVVTPAPDEWRISIALAYAEQVIANGVLTPQQADAIRQRIRRGV